MCGVEGLKYIVEFNSSVGRALPTHVAIVEIISGTKYFATRYVTLLLL